MVQHLQQIHNTKQNNELNEEIVSRAEISCKEKLKKILKDNPEILVLQAEKDNATVFMSDRKSEFEKNMIEILSDVTAYITLKSDSCRYQENSNEFVKIIDPSTPQETHTTEIHKNNITLRPIVSSIKPFTYRPVKFYVFIY